MPDTSQVMQTLSGMGITPQMVSHFLNGTITADNLHMKPKPRYQETIPVWKEQVTLGMNEQNDMRRWTQCRCWIKPPSQSWGNAAVFLSLVNAKGSVFVRLNSLSELEALSAAFTTWIPQIKSKLEELKPLEAQMALAREAYDTVLQNTPTEEE